MKRIIKVLVVSALMVVLMATTVSPAFASHHGGNSCDDVNGWGGLHESGCYSWKTYGDDEGPETYGFGGDSSWKERECIGYGDKKCQKHA